MSQSSSGGLGAGTVLGAVSGVAVTSLPMTGAVEQQNPVIITIIVVCGALIEITSIVRIVVTMNK